MDVEESLPELLTRSEAAAYLRLSPATLAKWACARTQPLPMINPHFSRPP